MDSDLIEKTKNYAREHNVSLSGLTERYYRALTAELADDKISPLVRELSGIIRAENAADIQAEYSTFLMEKYSR